MNWQSKPEKGYCNFNLNKAVNKKTEIIPETVNQLLFAEIYFRVFTFENVFAAIYFREFQKLEK